MSVTLTGITQRVQKQSVYFNKAWTVDVVTKTRNDLK